VQIFQVLHKKRRADLQEFSLFICLERNGAVNGNCWVRSGQH
jgi:hypothetical protein